MRRIVAKAGGDTDTSRDYEYTDWNQVRGFARDFGRLFERRPSRTAPELHAVTS
jgi:menaquinone-dependent protoporphyrinogen oxidase